MNRKTFYLLICLYFMPFQAMAELSVKQQKDFVYFTSFGRAEDVALLLNAGADPNARDEFGWPMLSVAAGRSDEEALKILRLLVDAGADLDAKDGKDNYPLMVAVRNNNAPMASYLISKGANVLIQDKNGMPLLTLAERTGNAKIIDIVKSYITAHEELEKQRRNPENMKRLFRDYFYYNCTYQYLTYNLNGGLYLDPKLKAEAEALLPKQTQKIQTTLADLYTYFLIRGGDLEESGKAARTIIANDLNALISNRNRRAKGVGKESDMAQRCTAIGDKMRDKLLVKMQKAKR